MPTLWPLLLAILPVILATALQASAPLRGSRRKPRV
jgi:hypothetical protein